jgi:excisionase family DNA binding protein
MSEITLAEAAQRAGVAASTLRNQVKRGRLRARLIGKTWVVAEDEVERYRVTSKGKAGRPRKGDGTSASAHPRDVDRARLGLIAGRYGIRSVALFGSAARNEWQADSDVDIIIDLEPAAPVTLFDHARIADDLSALFRRHVDLVTWNALRPRIRSVVEREALPLISR